MSAPVKHKFRLVHDITCGCRGRGGPLEGQLVVVHAIDDVVYLDDAEVEVFPKARE